MKLKLRKIGNSIGVIIPKEHLAGYNIDEVIEVNVITRGEVITNKQQNVITPDFIKHNAAQWCKKHEVRKGTCRCK